MRGDSSTSRVRRVFLGWERPPLEAAAAWLAERPSAELGRTLVALPGARAARALRERLARELGASWTPPRFLTAGELTDELLEVPAAIAPRIVRTLAWQRALAGLPREILHALVPRPPSDHDHEGWNRLAEEARRLFGEIAAEGLSFDDVAERTAACASTRESARWRALAAAQTAMRTALDEAGLADPHLARITALDAGRVRGERPVVLVGIVDGNELLRRTLGASGADVTALVFAPDELAADFDGTGFLQTAAWCDRDVELALDAWHVVEGPDDQARRVCQELARMGGTHTADDVTIGVTDREVVPYLARRLEAADVRARDAAGTPVRRTPPARLLEAVARFLSEPDHPSFAALARHPDLRATWSRAGLTDNDVPATIDAWQRAHLPGRLIDEWPQKERARAARVVWQALSESLGALAEAGERPLGQWCEPIRELLVRVYRESSESASAAATHGALAAIGAVLAELEAVPSGLEPRVAAAEALRHVLRALDTRALPPPPPALRKATVDLLGWLELPYDDAKVLIVTGFQEGQVPAAIDADAFLPNGLRVELGLVDERRRVARDVYALTLCARTREKFVLVTGRRSGSGDPLLPSRLAFHCGRDELLARVAHVFERRGSRATPARGAALASRSLPRLSRPIELESVRVSGFAQFLSSPYLFYVHQILGLETLDDRADEMDPRAFGLLTHEVLLAFGQSDRAESTDAERIASFLLADLDQRIAATYGRTTLPAVALQREQLAWRLRAFAKRQAEHRADGWRIEHVEWGPRDGRLLSIDRQAPVRIRGRIDRIDRHERTGQWAVFDYKTGDTIQDPTTTHRARDGTFRDLQLPLYAWLAETHVGTTAPRLGYAAIGKDEKSIGFRFADKLGPQIVQDALEEAKRIVIAVRAGEVFELGKPRSMTPVLAALCGTELLAIEDEEEGEERS